MDTRHSNLLSELRYAMDEAFGKSERVIAAIVALQRAGQGVKIAIDTALVDIGVPTARFPATMGRSDCSGVLMLDANDLLFLHNLKISAGIGVAER
jgi:hypothetical protein